MGNTHPGFLILFICIGVLVILTSRAVRMLAVIGVVIALVIAGKNVFIHEKSCPRTGEECFIELQPTWAGSCTSGDRAGILKIDGSYYLTAEAGAEASASCLDLRFWQ